MKKLTPFILLLMFNVFGCASDDVAPDATLATLDKWKQLPTYAGADWQYVKDDSSLGTDGNDKSAFIYNPIMTAKGKYTLVIDLYTHILTTDDVILYVFGIDEDETLHELTRVELPPGTDKTFQVEINNPTSTNLSFRMGGKSIHVKIFDVHFQ